MNEEDIVERLFDQFYEEPIENDAHLIPLETENRRILRKNQNRVIQRIHDNENELRRLNVRLGVNEGLSMGNLGNGYAREIEAEMTILRQDITVAREYLDRIEQIFRADDAYMNAETPPPSPREGKQRESLPYSPPHQFGNLFSPPKPKHAFLYSYSPPPSPRESKQRGNGNLRAILFPRQFN